MQRTVWVFGLISGALLSLFMIITLPLANTIGIDKGEIFGYTGMVLGFLLVYFGIRSYRDNIADGRISFGRAFTIGILITIISSACYVVTWEVIYFKVMPDFGAKYAQHMIQAAQASGASQEAIQAKVKAAQEFQRMYDKPLYNAAITFIEPFPVGLVITLICAGILRRQNKRGGHVVSVAIS